MADYKGRRFESLSAMLVELLGDRIVAPGEGFRGVIADDIVMDFPYSPPGPPSVAGADAVMAHQAMLGERFRFDHMADPVLHETADPDVVVIEVFGLGHGIATGEPNAQHYVYVIRTRDGRIVHFKDYWNPVAYLRAL